MIGIAWSCEVLYLVHKALIRLSMYRLPLYVNLYLPCFEFSYWWQPNLQAHTYHKSCEIRWSSHFHFLAFFIKAPPSPPSTPNVYKIATHSVSASISNFCPPHCHKSQSEVFTTRGADCSEHQLITADHHTPWFLTNLEPRPDCSR